METAESEEWREMQRGRGIEKRREVGEEMVRGKRDARENDE